MKRVTRFGVIMVLAGFGALIHERAKEPKPRVKAPVTRYHGYELNRQAISAAKGFTVLISNEGFGGTSRGTGVLIDKSHVLTCAHMVEGPDTDMWIFPYPGGLVVKGRPVAVNRDADLAVLELNKAVELERYATFQEMHYDGEPITIIGNTLGAMRWFVSFGIVSGEDEGYLLTDGVLYGGNSGGPWVNERGEVVAITDWTLLHNGTESGVHGGVSARTIHEFLKEWRSPSIMQVLQMMLGGN